MLSFKLGIHLYKSIVKKIHVEAYTKATGARPCTKDTDVEPCTKVISGTESHCHDP